MRPANLYLRLRIRLWLKRTLWIELLSLAALAAIGVGVVLVYRHF